MKVFSCLLAGLLWFGITDIVMGHGGGGGGTRTYKSEKPHLKIPAVVPEEDPAPVMVMKVVDQQIIHITFNNAFGDPVNVEMAEAKAFVSSASGSTIVRLLPTDINVLSGKGNFASERDMRVDISLRLMGKRPINKTFYPMRPADH